jgi:hypothetical protein
MRAPGKLMAVVALAAIVLAASTAWGQPGCCECQDCDGPEICLTLADAGDEESCSKFCNFYECAGKALVTTPSGCQVGPQCEEVFAVNPAPALSANGLALVALLTFGLGTIAVRRQERRRLAFVKSS